MRPWSQTVAVVTGASRGIGRAVVEALVGRGATVGCVSRSKEDLDHLSDGLSGPGRVELAAADVGIRAEIESAMSDLASRLGRIDVLVNNAGVGQYGPVLTLDPDEAERLIQVNYLGTFYTVRAVLPEMLKRRAGHIVNVASVAGRLGGPFEAAYAASKFAVVGFTESLAVETASFGVKVSMVNPGPVQTGFFATRGHPYERRRPRPISAAEVAGAVMAVLEDGRLEKTVPRALRYASVVREVLPGLYFSGTRRAFRSEINRLRSDLEQT